MAWNSMLPKIARFGPPRITVAVTEKTARRTLGIKKPKPIIWNGIPLVCVGSPAWRRKIWEARNEPAVASQRCVGCNEKTATEKIVCQRCLELAGVVDRHSTTSPEGRS